MELKALRVFVAAVLGAAVVTLGAPAHGSNVRSVYDPDLFFGEGLFSVDPSCLAPANWGLFVTNNLGGCVVGLLSDTTTVTSPTLTHIDFTPFSPPDNFGVFDIHVSLTGELDGVNSGIFDGNAIDGLGGSWGLEFVATGVGDFGVSNVVNLYRRIFDEIDCQEGCYSFFDVAPTVSFEPVPEPGSMALILGALGAGWLARRRKPAV